MAGLLEKKLRALEDLLTELPGALVAYSGGCDSAFLAEVAHRVLGERAIMVTADSPSLPRRELRAAHDLARQRGWTHRIVRTLEVEDERYAANPVDRCYFCKSALFGALEPLSQSLGWPVTLGTVSDDLGDWRPGLRAADERGALHPLAEVGLRKAEVRQASRALKLPTAEKPAAACLASRFAYGVRVTAAGLERVERAEDELLRRGFRVVRVRDLGGNRARIEVGSDEVASLVRQKRSVTSRLRGLGFAEVIFDERGYRSGSLNEGVAVAISSPFGGPIPRSPKAIAGDRSK
jgi:uncharacterized protein